MPLDSQADLRFAWWEVELERGGEVQGELGERTEELRVAVYEHGQADDFDLKLDNTDRVLDDPAIFRLGDRIRFWVWFADRPRTFMGTFQVDDILSEAPPSTVRVSGLAADTTRKTLRTLKTRGFERGSLFRIVREIAREHGLTPVIKGDDLTMERKEQKEEHDLRFLTRIGEEYGFLVRVREPELQFIAREIQEAEAPLSLDGLLRKRAVRVKSFNTYKQATARYFDPHSKSHRQAEVRDQKAESEQTLKLTARVESLEQATRMAGAKLKAANRKRAAAEFECLGVPELTAGINVRVAGEGGQIDGVWHVEEAHHKYDKASGYTVELKAYKLERAA